MDFGEPRVEKDGMWAEVIYVDCYGNVILNIPNEGFELPDSFCVNSF